MRLAAMESAYADLVEGQARLPHPLTTLNAARVAVSTAGLATDGRAEALAQADLARCLLGNPLSTVVCPPAWRTSTVLTLAEQVLRSGEFGAMPILADALQDADCHDEGVLSHCRGPGPHVRGCWVLDMVLGKG